MKPGSTQDDAAIEVFAIENPPYGSMTYVLSGPGRKALVIDPGGSDTAPLFDYLQTARLEVAFVVLTHEHFDHIAGLEEVRRQYHCPLICSRACSEAIIDPTLNFSRYLLGRDVVCGAADRLCEDLGWIAQWEGVSAEFIESPGHSRGSICVVVGGRLFTGDTLLPEVKRVTKLPGGNKVALEKSLDYLFSRFGPGTTVYPGHGRPFDIGAVAERSRGPAPNDSPERDRNAPTCLFHL